MAQRIWVGMVLGLLVAASSARAQVDKTADWVVEAHAMEESVGQGLPVLALGRKDWFAFNPNVNQAGRAWRSIQADVSATHPSGWQVVAVVRAEAQVNASADTVALLALNATHTDPSQARPYALALQTQGWLGDGIALGTPWLALTDANANVWAWQGQMGVQVLTLRKLLREELGGALQYQGNAVYDFDAHITRSQTDITGPYLAAPGTSGQGVAFAFALQGKPAPAWRINLRADDVFSRLVWPHMPTDASTLRSQVTTRAADGTLDYGPLVTGRIALNALTTRIGPHWQAHARWAVHDNDPSQGSVTLRTDHKAGINQAWVGWESGSQAHSALHWTVAVEPWMAAMSTSLQWRGARLAVATDGKGMTTRYRQLYLGWRVVL